MQEIHALIFDMDGVIADSEPLHFEAERLILSQSGIDVPVAEWENFMGLSDKKIFQYILDHYTDGHFDMTALLTAKYEVFLKLLTEKLQPITGALDFIHWARAHYAHIALTTSSTQSVQQTIFNLFDLTRYFDVIITGDHIRYGKPHPEPYLMTIKALNVSAAQCLVIEDSVHGITSAKSAGCQVAALMTSFPRAALEAAGADYIVENFANLYDYMALNRN